MLNVGEGAMQVWHPIHMHHCAKMDACKEHYMLNDDNDDFRDFLKIFQESTTREGSKAAARKMEKIAERQTKNNQKMLLFQSIFILLRTDSERLLWPDSPLPMMLQFVDPNVLTGPESSKPFQEDLEIRSTPLHHLAYLADPINYSVHENQVTLGRELIEHGANVNALSFPGGETPLHLACGSQVTTNLDFIQFLLDNGADPNLKDDFGRTPLMRTITMAPGAAKFLLEWPTTDANITTRSGTSFLALVRGTMMKYAEAKAASNGDYAGKVAYPFVLHQWREVEGMLVKRGAIHKEKNHSRKRHSAIY
jgi:hypothetical protein